MVSPTPMARCMSTVSTQRSCFQPIARNVPTIAKPSAAWMPMDGALALSPMTAINWRQPMASHSAMRRASSARPMPLPRKSG